jgi:hypothetical protein
MIGVVARVPVERNNSKLALLQVSCGSAYLIGQPVLINLQDTVPLNLK